MALLEVYCPCKVNEIGTAKITGDAAYLIWRSKEQREEGKMTYTKCKHCGEPIKYIHEEK